MATWYKQRLEEIVMIPVHQTDLKGAVIPLLPYRAYACKTAADYYNLLLYDPVFSPTSRPPSDGKLSTYFLAFATTHCSNADR